MSWCHTQRPCLLLIWSRIPAESIANRSGTGRQFNPDHETFNFWLKYVKKWLSWERLQFFDALIFASRVLKLNLVHKDQLSMSPNNSHSEALVHWPKSCIRFSAIFCLFVFRWFSLRVSVPGLTEVHVSSRFPCVILRRLFWPLDPKPGKFQLLPLKCWKSGKFCTLWLFCFAFATPTGANSCKLQNLPLPVFWATANVQTGD